MITPVNILLILIWGLIIPYIMGGAVGVSAKSSDGRVNCKGNLPFGFMLMCGLFIIPAIPMILLHVPFHVLKYTWMVLAAAVCIWVLAAGIKKGMIRDLNPVGYLKRFIKDISSDRFILCVWLAAFLLIIFQTLLLTVRMHTDTDDARFIVDAMEALSKDTMLEYNPITNIHHGIPVGEQIKDVTAPYPLFIALMSSLTGVHPAIMAHTVMPALFIPLCYLVFALIGSLIFEGDVKKRGLFLLFLSLIHLFSFETIYSAGYTLLTIIWQGRSVAAMIMLPLLWYLLLKLADKDKAEAGDFALIGLASLANAMLSNMGSLFAFILCMAYALSISIRDKKIMPLVFMGLAMVPDLAVIVLNRVLSSGILYR